MYEIRDDQMAAGSTFGAPKAMLVIKPTGAIEKFYSIETGREVFGTVVLHHWDPRNGVPLTAMPGEFILHPDRQEHVFELSNGVTVSERIFVLSGMPDGDRVDPPAAYYCVELCNDTDEPRCAAAQGDRTLPFMRAGDRRLRSQRWGTNSAKQSGAPRSRKAPVCRCACQGAGIW